VSWGLSMEGDPLIRRYELGPPLASARIDGEPDAVVQLRRAGSGRLWTFWRDANGSTASPVDPSGTAWASASTLVVAGEAHNDASAVEVAGGERILRILPAGNREGWLLVTRRPTGIGDLTVRQLGDDGRIVAVSTIPMPRSYSDSSALPRWWRRRRLAWWQLRRVPSGHTVYGPLDDGR
jgi:hypothetical protein